MRSAIAEESMTDGLQRSPISLFLDVDGTLLDLAPRPGAVVVPESLVASLAEAEKVLDGALALVSGRSIDDLDRLFAPLNLRASGVHGAQIRFAPRGQEQPDAEAEGLPRKLWMALTEALFDFPGTFAENKRYSFAVHYRTMPVVKRQLRQALTRLIAVHADLDLDMLHGHSVFEIKPRGFDKGKAIERFIIREPFLGRMPVFIGDDATDEAGFAAVIGHGGRAFSVGSGRPGVSGVFPSPESVRRWLTELGRPRARA
ncbi:MAG: trehalose-phosphatase [Hyphomicrobiales bacterium]